MEIQMTNIHKQFAANQVLKGVHFNLKAGEVHSLMGENGAGKSTLMNILTGLLKTDQGKITIDGKETVFANPKDAENHRISFIHQELITWPEMTVLENMFMGKEMTKYGIFCNQQAMEEKAEAVLKQLGIQIDLNDSMGKLSIGQQQLIEIAKILMNEASVIIMDEPTAALTDKEIVTLFSIIRKLKQKGVAIVYISHRLKEIFEISDRITVMRDGISIMTRDIKETQEKEIVSAMVGRDIGDYYPSERSKIGRTLLEVNDLTVNGLFKDITFTLKQGEILGVSGLMGAGRTEIMSAIFGLHPLERGTIAINDKVIQISSPLQAIKNGIGYVTENRKEEGLILDFSIKDNIGITALDEFSEHGFIHNKEEEDFVQLLIERLAIKTGSMHLPVSSLSGGNQQKVVLAKWIAAGTQILILDEPTRGVDIGAKREIYLLMRELTDRGVGIIMVSSDLPEIIGVSDRVLVIHEGQVNGCLTQEELSEERIMTLATGGK
ncbi:sugar ABC transporter ATP-binding protein [Facklamia miroungae]|uniref:Ribose transport system ATP-binding protein n=1 Tax=Facklamia miroungae TaxID=120956 RepID=A0A1G7QBK5_9LACT|nr:sugar ABC transporter ATP-binding protein [Facklamia miroungae]NKZ28892.1 sugar ABC transporter ATP-binding protein [Facklamia miroungae]SDF95967.1 ribose transport system ATP-binding protein [Facklamia miroungae]